jgi:hypothetical protein
VQNKELKKYQSLLINLKKKFDFVSFENFKKKRCIILRHDIDFCLDSALKMARLENKLKIKANYFFLSSYFYKINSKNSQKIISKIDKMGHFIGLHYDFKMDKSKINKDKKILKIYKNYREIISIHKPKKIYLGRKLKNKNHTYEKKYFSEKIYFSDSRGVTENIFKNIDKIKTNLSKQILVHPFWYINSGKNPLQKMIKWHNKKKISINFLKKNYNIK